MRRQCLSGIWLDTPSIRLNRRKHRGVELLTIWSNLVIIMKYSVLIWNDFC